MKQKKASNVFNLKVYETKPYQQQNFKSSKKVFYTFNKLMHVPALYVCVHIEILPLEFCILNLIDFRVIFPQSLYFP